MTLDIATRMFLEKAAEKPGKPREQMTPQEARDAVSGISKVIGKGAPMFKVSEVQVPADGGMIATRILTPSCEPSHGVIVYLHGGGWVTGSPDEFEPLCRNLAAGTGCVVAIVDYRRAPEHPYPGPVDDSWAAVKWVAANLTAIAGRQVPLLIAGDSAGANLAIAVTLRARDQQRPRLDGQLLFYPVTDCDLETDSYNDPANHLMLTKASMAYYWDLYLPDKLRRLETEASPLRCPDLSRLPPAIVITAEHDVLRDEGEAYARRLAEANVNVTLQRSEGQIHAFLMMVDLLPGSAAGLEFASSQIRALMAKLSDA